MTCVVNPIAWMLWLCLSTMQPHTCAADESIDCCLQCPVLETGADVVACATTFVASDFATKVRYCTKLDGAPLANNNILWHKATENGYHEAHLCLYSRHQQGQSPKANYTQQESSKAAVLQHSCLQQQHKGDIRSQVLQHSARVAQRQQGGLTLSCTSCRLATTSTLPVALTGLISCQAPSSAAALKPGSMALRMRLTAKAGPPLTTSSANSSTAQSSTLKAFPKALEMGCSRAFTASLVSEMALLMRSITAVAWNVTTDKRRPHAR